MSTSTSTPLAPPSTSVLFARGVIARLATWHALRIAVDQRWGGPESAQKRIWLASVIVDAFEEQDPTPDIEYVELILLQVLEDEFEVVLEDGSAERVAEDIVKLWETVKVGNDEVVRSLEERADKVKGQALQAEKGAEDGSDWDDESGEEDIEEQHDAPMLLDHTNSPKPEPGVDEDGFTTVRGRGKSYR